jgi:ribosomal-protein-alanine N-acetyltransferase
MTGSRVRLARIGLLNRAVVSALHSKCFDEEQWDEPAFAGILAIPGTFGSIALMQDTPAGFVIARVVYDECEILSLGVCPELRQRGLGRTLLKSVLDHVLGSEARTIYLEVAEDNAAAQQLYATEGFAVIGKRQGYFRRGPGRTVAALVLSRVFN